jgi:1,4-alpha-glucan branching enzyme
VSAPREPVRYAIVDRDSWLAPYAGDIDKRMELYHRTRDALTGGGVTRLSEFANGHEYFGFHRVPETGGWVYREWAPAADAIFLTGDFNGWNPASDPLARVGPGVWEVRLDGSKALALCHLSRVKARHPEQRHGCAAFSAAGCGSRFSTARRPIAL